jgi:exopolyphosphatase/guanosine-5'-triphosphate,3'-diphosphate pyrophosphatase
VRQPALEADSVCGLDIGSNTFTCAEIAALMTGGDIAVLRDSSRVSRLSENLEPGGSLDPRAISRSLEVLERLSAEFDLPRKRLRAVGTQVLRMTSDPAPFTEPAREIIGTEIEIVTGETEALLVSRGAIVGLEQHGPWAVLDVGGQSTELCRQTSDGWRPLSLPIGVVTLTTTFLRSDPPRTEEIESLRAHVREAFTGAVERRLDGQLVAVAGTATTLAMLELDSGTWQRERVHGLELSRERVEHWLAAMVAVDSATRTERFGVRPGRADVFPAGICVLDELLAHTRADRLTVSANGLRIGAALSLLKEN